LMPRVSAWSGVLGFPLFFTVLTVTGLITPGYSAIRQHGSDLSILQYAWLFDVSLTAYGLSLFIFAVGFHRATSPNLSRRGSTAVTTLLVLSAIGGILAGVFNIDVPWAYFHALGGVLIFGLPPVAQVVAGKRLRQVRGSERYGEYTLITGVIMLSVVIFSTFYPILKFVHSMVPLVNALDNQFTGLLQRIQMIGTWGWFSVTGARFLSLQKEGAPRLLPKEIGAVEKSEAVDDRTTMA